MMPRLVLLSAILLGGCTLGPDYVRPALPKADVFPEAGKGGAAIRSEWWKSLGDPELDALVAKALVVGSIDLPKRTPKPELPVIEGYTANFDRLTCI